MKITHQLILLMCLVLFGACTTDVAVKNVHEEPAGMSDVANEPAATPATAVSGDTSGAEPVAAHPEDEAPLTELELQKYAYELGLDPRRKLTDEERARVLERRKLRRLERSLDSQRERVQYSKVLPWLNGDSEKIEMLSIPSIEGRQAWINKNRIWSRVKNLSDFDDVVEAQDIALGMPADYVRKSWGEPDQVETSGNPIYRNERWQYTRQISTPQGYKQQRRSVYFEGGRVVGWETE